jgi:hypothetical protein
MQFFAMLLTCLFKSGELEYMQDMYQWYRDNDMATISIVVKKCECLHNGDDERWLFDWGTSDAIRGLKLLAITITISSKRIRKQSTGPVVLEPTWEYTK